MATNVLCKHYNFSVSLLKAIWMSYPWKTKPLGSWLRYVAKYCCNYMTNFSPYAAIQVILFPWKQLHGTCSHCLFSLGWNFILITWIFHGFFNLFAQTENPCQVSETGLWFSATFISRGFLSFRNWAEIRHVITLLVSNLSLV